MKKMLLLCGALLVVSASVAAAAPTLNLAWGTCLGEGGASLQTSACTANANTGANAFVLVPSIVFDADVAGLIGFDSRVTITTPTALPAWWGVGCTGKTSIVASSGTAAYCLNDAFGGNGAGGNVPLSGSALYPFPNQYNIRFAFAVPTGVEVALTPGEYETVAVTIQNSKTVGTGACAGCAGPACLTFAELQYAGINGVSGTITAGNSPIAYWQAAGATCAGSTPTRNATWGGVKALYR
jgi:hypothetical protein